MNPMSLELLAADLVHDRIAFAAQQNLISQLPRTHSVRPDVIARQYLASGLRVLATRLDPCLAVEPNYVVASQR